jgi:hypothetical protein
LICAKDVVAIERHHRFARTHPHVFAKLQAGRQQRVVDGTQSGLRSREHLLHIFSRQPQVAFRAEQFALAHRNLGDAPGVVRAQPVLRLQPFAPLLFGGRSLVPHQFQPLFQSPAGLLFHARDDGLRHRHRRVHIESRFHLSFSCHI